ncbi:PadR family transcriptional regulator [Rhodococcus sp. 05-2254-5]|uniref:PadR family transcriptional regulator n=1 Tax=unclassified Rhodococcus (in: high G+C Gram-positive bacteria) TaxID=192944 RepID=UPI000B9C3D3A|nr:MULTISPECIES: PadR family transcriptional regulator [unclassified Rhodococcus (in: high G+C Gram-positive bacteria)]OZE32670.1 PadR family transcriptional regulator [Rhodococcus sp. 05-2254-5]OZE48547.1 PadR family transcriptional regulator [Rhodococcus sp. 05-2254-1]
MLELAILGFLSDGPLHGYELKRRVTQLTGYAKPVSDGTLYPAIKRLDRSGLLMRRSEPGAGPARYVLTITDEGRDELTARLRDPQHNDVSDFSRFVVVLTFLSLVPSVEEQHAVLRRRLQFLEQPASFFYDGDRAVKAEEVTDIYRRGLLLVARETSRAERAWLTSVLEGSAPRR